MIKLAEFLRAGCIVKVLLADLHAVLDNLKAPLELVKFRAAYYRLIITALLKAINVPIDRIEFVLGTSYQLTEKYTLDFHRLSTVVSERNAKKAGTQVLKQVDDPPVSGLNYPLMQALDEEYLGVDAQFGGVDQRKIFTLATEQLPKIGYKKRAHLMNPMVPGLQGGKMSSSEADSKIDILDPPDVVQRKLKKTPLAPREVENNGVLSFVEFVLLPISQLQRGGTPEFVIEPREGEPRIYHEIEALKNDYRSDTVSPGFSISPAWKLICFGRRSPPNPSKQASRPR
jgi:tyrosyl-tRNA synthetase